MLYDDLPFTDEPYTEKGYIEYPDFVDNETVVIIREQA